MRVGIVGEVAFSPSVATRHLPRRAGETFEGLPADVGRMILMGAVISIPMLIVAVFYCMWIGKQIYQIPTDDGGFERKEFKQEYVKSMEELNRLIGEKQLPSLGWSIAPIVVPLVLILTKTVLDFTGHSNQVVTFLGAYSGGHYPVHHRRHDAYRAWLRDRRYHYRRVALGPDCRPTRH